MIAVNLIPESRRLVRRRRARIRTWIVGCAGYCLFLAVAFTVSTVVGTGDDAVVRTELESITEQQESTERSTLALQGQLDQAAELLEANLAVGNQPDWGILLALLSSTIEEDIVLRHLDVSSSTASSSSPAPSDRTSTETKASPRKAENIDSVLLELGGLAPSPEGVSSFVLRLDQIELFSTVKLIDTKREPFLDGFATAFRVECALVAAGAETP